LVRLPHHGPLALEQLIKRLQVIGHLLSLLSLGALLSLAALAAVTLVLVPSPITTAMTLSLGFALECAVEITGLCQ